MRIGDYECTSPFVTAGSGNARWCVAVKEEKRYFLKQFLSPVQPVQAAGTPPEMAAARRERCASFERRKMQLYKELNQIHGEWIVCIDDFFVHDGHYYTASEYVAASNQTLNAVKPERETALRLLLSLAECLRALHARGVVHADLKPEHVVACLDEPPARIRLIDFDSGFLESAPPEPSANNEVDPVYLSPEGYLSITGKPVKLNRKLDTFALGILIHETLTGELPGFDRNQYAYLYACVLDRGKIALSPTLDKRQRTLIRRMLRRNPAFRPGDGAVVRALRAIRTSG